MQIINISKTGVESGLEGGVIAIGNFDGVHLGHQGIIETLKHKGKSDKKPVGILTFEPSPYSFFKVEKHYQIISLAQKARILKDMGVDFLAYADFNEKFSQTPADNFVKDVLVNRLKVAHVFTGDDFKFGFQAKGNAALLAEMAKELNFGYTPIAEISGPEGQKLRSSVIRRFLSEGKMQEAAFIMGREFEIEGVVAPGNKQGGILGFPTANIEIGHYVMPRKGVYKCTANVDGEEYKAVANFGGSPTFNVEKPVLETHILEFDDNIYGKNISVKLKSFIRDIKKFASKEELIKQIEQDERTAWQR